MIVENSLLKFLVQDFGSFKILLSQPRDLRDWKFDTPELQACDTKTFAVVCPGICTWNLREKHLQSIIVALRNLHSFGTGQNCSANFIRCSVEHELVPILVTFRWGRCFCRILIGVCQNCFFYLPSIGIRHWDFECAYQSVHNCLRFIACDNCAWLLLGALTSVYFSVPAISNCTFGSQ